MYDVYERIKDFQRENHCFLDKGIEGTVLNPTYHFKKGGYLNKYMSTTLYVGFTYVTRV